MTKFRAIPGYEGSYEVSADGVVRSLARVVSRADGTPLRVRERIMKTTVSNRGYERTSLIRDGKPRRVGVHQLVAAAWLPKPPRHIGTDREGFVVNHKDGNKLNNNADNLEYVSTLANIAHARAHGLLSVKGVKNNKAKLTDDDVRAIREKYSRGVAQVALAKEYGVNQTTISLIVRRAGWAHVA